MSKIIIAFRDLDGSLDEASLKAWAEKNAYTTKIFNFNQVDEATKFVESVDLKENMLEILGFSKGVESAYELARFTPEITYRRLLTIGTYWGVTKSFEPDGVRPPRKNVEDHKNYVEIFQQPNGFGANPINVSLGICKHQDAVRKALEIAPRTISMQEVADIRSNAVSMIDASNVSIQTGNILPASVFEIPDPVGIFKKPAVQVSVAEPIQVTAAANTPISPGVVVVEIPRPIPMRFFMNCNDGISPAEVKKHVAKYGYNVLIGIDPGSSDRPDDGTMQTIDAVKEAGAALHVYLVGPGMMSWSEEERRQIANFAESVGIDLKKSNWHDIWKMTGWKKKNLEQFEYYWTEHKAYSCEIDNIDSSYIENDPEETVKFYSELKNNLKEKHIGTKLMMKNLDEDQLQAVIDASFGLEFLCNFAMFEEGTGDPKTQIKLCEKLGVQAITPINGITDTHHYGVIDEGVPYTLKR